MAAHPTSGMIELLVEEKLLSKKQMKQLAKEVGKTDRSTVEIIIESGVLSPEEITEFIDSLGIEHIVPDAVEIDWDAVRKIGHERAQSEAILPIMTSSREKEIAVSDPLDSALSTELGEILEKSVVLIFALPEEIRKVYSSVSMQTSSKERRGHEQDFSNFIADETSYKAVDVLRKYIGERKEWSKPVLLVGDGCVGKTHLIQAARSALSDSYPEVNIILADGQAIMDDPAVLGREHLPEGFLLDGLEYIAGDPRAEEVFMQIFNAVFQQGGPIIVTAAAALSSITELSMRVKASLAICRTVTIGNPRPETQEAIGRKLCVGLEIDPDGIDWVALISEARGDLRKIIEALESGKVARAAASNEPSTSHQTTGEGVSEQTGSTTMADTLREEAEAIIEEARLAIEEIEMTVTSDADTMLSEAKATFDEALNAIHAGDYVRSEQLGMEALEKAEHLLKQSAVEFEAHNYGGALYLAVQSKNQVGTLDQGFQGRDTGVKLAGERGFDQPLPLKLTKNTNLRAGPGLTHSIRSTLNSDTLIIGYGYKDDWIRIETEEGQSGWVHQSLVMAR